MLFVVWQIIRPIIIIKHTLLSGLMTLFNRNNNFTANYFNGKNYNEKVHDVVYRRDLWKFVYILFFPFIK